MVLSSSCYSFLKSSLMQVCVIGSAYVPAKITPEARETEKVSFCLYLRKVGLRDGNILKNIILIMSVQNQDIFRKQTDWHYTW